ALDPPGEVGAPLVAGLLGPGDRIVGGAPPSSGDLEAVADLDALDRLDAHDGSGEGGGEFSVPVDVTAEADGNPVGDGLDDAAQRITLLRGGFDLGDHGRRGLVVEAADLVVVDAVEIVGAGEDLGVGSGGTHLDDVRDD